MICGYCHALFNTAETPPYVGYDHLLDAHLDVLAAGHGGDVVLRDVMSTAKTILDAMQAELEEAAA